LSQYSKGWILTRRHWAGRLLQDPAFKRRLEARWRELDIKPHVTAAIAGAERDLRGDVGRNFTRWPVLHTPLWPATKARGSHGAEVRFLKTWMNRRITWMDRRLR
jgi:hypothetical protein